jgi:hypothetical protein
MFIDLDERDVAVATASLSFWLKPALTDMLAPKRLPPLGGGSVFNIHPIAGITYAEASTSVCEKELDATLSESELAVSNTLTYESSVTI